MRRIRLVIFQFPVLALWCSTGSAGVQVDDNSIFDKRNGILILNIDTKVDETEFKSIESEHRLLVKNPNQNEETFGMGFGHAVTRSNTLKHHTYILRRYSAGDIMARVKKGGRVFSRARTVVNGVADVKETTIVEK